MRDGTSQGRSSKCSRVTVRYYQSSGGQVADDPDMADNLWDDIVTRAPELAMDAPIPLETGERALTLTASHRKSINVAVRQRQPLPLNVTALIVQADIYQAT